MADAKKKETSHLPKTRRFSFLISLLYPTIRFVESSKAKEAVETIKAEEAKGNTLISLWKIYSDIELQRANRYKRENWRAKF